MQECDLNQSWSVQKEGSDRIRITDLPDDAMLRENRSPKAKSGSGGAFFDGGKYIYRKDWQVSEEFCRKTLFLEFEGVYQKASVLLNGEKIAEHPYGYTGFLADATGRVREGRNELTVIADNSAIPNTRWYSGSGIYREVHLHVGGNEYVAPGSPRITVLDDERIRVQMSGRIDGSSRVRVRIFSGNSCICEGEGMDVILQIPDVRHWDAEHPYLYTCEVCIENEGSVTDKAVTSFGMRTLGWGKDGFLVNGKPVLLRGACIHHDNGILGACAFRDAEERRIRIMKEAGFNAVRSAHNPISKAMLRACDRMGMYVMDEAFDMWLVHKNPCDYAGETFRSWWCHDLAAMIDKDFSHPSVVMYSIGNEISELGREDGQEMARKMTDFCHRMDSGRPVTAGVNLALAQMASFSRKSKPFANESEQGTDDTAKAPTSEFFNKLMNYLGNRMDKAASTRQADRIAEVLRGILDIPGYNYAASRYKKDALNVPGQPEVGSETMTHTLYRNWQLVEQIPALIGDFMWTGWDYLGESGIGTIRYLDRRTKKDVDPGLIISSGAGVIDICGKMRPEVGWNRIIWGLEKNPVIGVDPYTHTGHFKSRRMWRKKDTIASWSWEGCEGKKADVTVYSDAPYVELICNGVSLGRKKTSEDCAVFQEVPYQPGVLEASAQKENKEETGRSRLISAGRESVIRLTPDKKVLHANGQDLCFLDIGIADRNGVVKSSCDRKLTVTVTGAGKLQAFGSARPCMAEDFISTEHTAYYGRALAVIRAGYGPGIIRMEVTGPDLEKQTVEIETIPDRREEEE